MLSNNIYAYCRDDIRLIENYKQAINDQTQTWECHHKLEIELNLTAEELKLRGLYFHRPANELILLTKSEHSRVHALVPNNHLNSKEAQDKRMQTVSNWSEEYRLDVSKRISESRLGQAPWNKGIPSSEESRKKSSDSHKGIYKDYLWIKNENEETRIHKNNLDRYLDLGYERGRLYESSHASHPSPHRGKICINNGEKNKYIKEEKLEYYLSRGYKKGHIGKTRKGISPTNKGEKYAWVIKDKKPEYIKLDELEDYLSRGYKRGRK